MSQPESQQTAEHFDKLEERCERLEELTATEGWRVELLPWIELRHAAAMTTLTDLTKSGPEIEHARATVAVLDELTDLAVIKPAAWRVTLDNR